MFIYNYFNPLWVLSCSLWEPTQQQQRDSVLAGPMSLNIATKMLFWHFFAILFSLNTVSRLYLKQLLQFCYLLYTQFIALGKLLFVLSFDNMHWCLCLYFDVISIKHTGEKNISLHHKNEKKKKKSQAQSTKNFSLLCMLVCLNCCGIANNKIYKMRPSLGRYQFTRL